MAYQRQLLEMKDRISAISLAYKWLQVDHKALQAKLWKEEVKQHLIDFATNIT